MFKKSKNNKIVDAPSAPTIDEILADIETFQVDIESTPTANNPKHLEGSSQSLEKWWLHFEQFLNDLKCLEFLNSEIEGAKLKLESHKLEIETETKLLKNEIDEQKAKIDVALE
ncbi:uncharacterized protein LOC142223406 [Haematobia irritans]|uniref:uncharacterized protein LOC142223406 n=1 Tax=Haematobia irritans TaxID=7368 RepID=UPI003F4F9A7D